MISISDLLARASVADRQVQGFRSITETLEWRLADLVWAGEGVLPFAHNLVPHLSTSSGRLSHQAAQVLHASCLEDPPQGPLRVLELGAGTGLFARYFIDAFSALCQQSGHDFHERLVYLCTDRSARTVAQWAEFGLFRDDIAAGRVVTGTCDALGAGPVRTASGAEVQPDGLRAVLCNYILDILPARMLRRAPESIDELVVRTHLILDDNTVRAHTSLSLEEIRRLAASEDPADLARLVPLLTLLESESGFRPLDIAATPYARAALDLCPGAECLLLNHGALLCLESCLGRLQPGGFVLLSDYGPTRFEDAREQPATHRIGTSMSCGLNFALIDAYFPGNGVPVLTPSGDEPRPLHNRLLLPSPAPEATAAAFAAAFSQEALSHVDGPIAEARGHLGAGRRQEALDAYREALRRSPRDFLLLGEAAEFATSHLCDYAAGLDLAQAATAMNPWYSGWLWNIQGDCLLCLGRLEEAHEAYLHAERIHPGDARTQLNLAVTLAMRHQVPEALQAVARGLLHDTQGIYRARLLEQQQQLLLVLSTGNLQADERAARRDDRLRLAVAAAGERS